MNSLPQIKGLDELIKESKECLTSQQNIKILEIINKIETQNKISKLKLLDILAIHKIPELLTLAQSLESKNLNEIDLKTLFENIEDISQRNPNFSTHDIIEILDNVLWSDLKSFLN